MINYIVEDLDALLERLKAEGVSIDPKREDSDFGRFAWIYDAGWQQGGALGTANCLLGIEQWQQ